MLRARSRMRTGSPMSSTKISPRAPIAPACTTRDTASGDRHEVARHVRMRHRHRPALGDLAPEDRDHAARRVEHVAEPHGDEPGGDVLALAIGLDDPLAERLRLAVDSLRVERLVGRDEHEPLGAELDGDLGDDLRRQHVVARRLERVRLHHRHVLVRGRVEDDLRPVPLEDLAQLVAVADVGQDRERSPGSRDRRRARVRSRRARSRPGRRG